MPRKDLERKREYERERYRRTYSKENPYYLRKKPGKKIWRRENQLKVNGKILLVRKREFIGICELCGRQIYRFPAWHHWNNKNPEDGLWFCNKYHRLAEAVEADPDFEAMKFYQKLKRLVKCLKQN